MICADHEMKRVGGAQAEHELAGKRSPARNCDLVTGRTVKLSTERHVNIASASFL
jgi:hypothetical protein